MAWRCHAIDASFESTAIAGFPQVGTYDDDGNGTIEGSEFYRHFVKWGLCGNPVSWGYRFDAATETASMARPV